MNRAFCDASFDHKHNLAVVGYRLEDMTVVTQVFNLSSSGEAEAKALEAVLEAIDNTNREGWIIYTDYIKSVNVGYQGDRKDIALAYVKGHIKKSLRSPIEQLFAEVDQATRKRLRQER